MMAGLKPYPKMKDSGVEWLGKVPGHWEVRRLKYLLRESDKRSSEGNEQLLRVSQYTGVTKRRPKDGTDEPDTRAASLIGYKSVDPTELVVNIMLAWNGSMGVSAFPGICSPAYCVYRFNDHAVPWYYHNLLRSPIYKARIKAVSTGVVESRLRLYTEDLYRLEGLFPPVHEQTAIVRYLDYVDHRVRRFIRSKKKLIKLLEEQKQAIIHRAVTRGLDPHVPMKDSGVEWLGKVPAHWEILSLKRIAKTKSGDGISAGNVASEYSPENRVQVIGGNGLMGYANSTNTDIGVLVIGRVGALCGNVHEVNESVWVTDNALVLAVTKNDIFNLKFLATVLRARNLNEIAEKTAQPLITGTKLRAQKVPLPPLFEQTAIVDYLDKDIIQLDTASVHANRQIELLNEYRTRLISDVVTGKLDVREVAANLPEEPEELAEPEDLLEDGEEMPLETDDILEEAAA